MQVAAGELHLQVCCVRRFDRKCAYSYLQECITANISQTTLDIDVKPAPQCALQSKDAEKCKKSKSEIFAVTGLLHPTDALCLARYRPMLSPVRLSARRVERWIIQKRLKLGSCNLHHVVAPSI